MTSFIDTVHFRCDFGRVFAERKKVEENSAEIAKCINCCDGNGTEEPWHDGMIPATNDHCTFKLVELEECAARQPQ